MRVLGAPIELADRPVAIAIGVFDGVHLGHQQVLNHALADARECDGVALAVTFDKHPAQIVAPARAPLLIYPLSQKLREIERCGINAIWIIAFNEAFSRVSARAFVEMLALDFQPLKSISVGESFSFGHKRHGNIQLLNAMAQEFGFEVNPVPAVVSDGRIISSSRIRSAIASGEIVETFALLGRPYSITGKVIEGAKLGRKLGFPTANIEVGGLALPPPGVYAVTVQIDGRNVPGAANLGYRPTVMQSSPQLTFEVHLIGWSGELYGRELEVKIERKLRDEMKFDSLDGLRRQIELDVQNAGQQK